MSRLLSRLRPGLPPLLCILLLSGCISHPFRSQVPTETAMETAVKALKDIVADTNATASSRVQAARTIIETGIKSVELDELERRLSAIEKQIQQRGLK